MGADTAVGFDSEAGQMRIDVHVHFDGPIGDRPKWVDEILAAIDVLEINMSKELDTLTAAVKRSTDATESGIKLLQGLSALLIAAKDDPAKIVALANEVNAEADAMTAAVLDNTPAAP